MNYNRLGLLAILVIGVIGFVIVLFVARKQK
jgi:preprotein translocase subunit Sss1